MKALQLIEYGKLICTDVPNPVLGGDEVLIRVRSAAICGSDVHGYDGSSGRRIPPMIMGHEAAGVIEDVGKNALRFDVGERVTFDSTLYCGACHFCRAGRINLCDERRVFGVSCVDYKKDGAFAEYIAVPERIVYRLPDSVSFDEAALVEPLAIAFHAVGNTAFRVGDTCAVVGMGTIGHMILKLIAVMGATELIAVDIDDAKLALAKKNGATLVLNPKDSGALDELKRLTSGGVDVAFEAVGISATLDFAMQSLRKGGELTLVGNIAKKAEFSLQEAVTRELRLNGSCASAGEYDICLKLIEKKKLALSDLISAKAPLLEGPVWFEKLRKTQNGLIKVILYP